MEPLTLKPRQPVTDDIECWDDDEDLHGIDDLQFRNVSSTTVGTNKSFSHHRDSISSRTSGKSEFDGDDDWQVLIPTDDDTSTNNAIASAKNAGIPIPSNVPASALLGGTIKRLGGRRLKKVLGDDWGEDLELPKQEEGGLKLKKQEEQDFPDALRQISAAFIKSPGPATQPNDMSFSDRIQSAGKAKATVSTLDKFRDNEDDRDFGDVPTIKVAKNRSSKTPLNFEPLTRPPTKSPRPVEKFDDDLIFPTDGEPLKLSARKEIPKTPASQRLDDFDADWGDGSQGSLGTSLGGTRRTGRSNRSSSISALSPSVFSPSLSSCLTAESEDEGLEGLVLPDGPLKFEETLKKRLESASPDLTDGRKPEVRAAAKEDDFSGIEIGDGDVFDSGKLTLNRNIKHKVARQTSPTRRTAMTLTFTNKPQAITTRIPKLQTQDRNRSKLETVSETGGPVSSSRRSQSRLGGHSTQSSVSSIPTPATPSHRLDSAPSTPSRRGLTHRPSRETLRTDTVSTAAPTTTGAQLLKAKRSVPAMRSIASPARPQASQRPPSRSEYTSRSTNTSRPKTPVDRTGAESSLGISRKPPVPFLPAGNSYAQSHHVSSKVPRNFYRPTSSDSNENVPLNRPVSRLSNPQYRSSSPNIRRDIASESLIREAAAKRTLTKPTRRRAFGDGTELDVFDDLPTSANIESKFVKQPLRNKASNLRSKLSSSQNPSTASLGRADASGPQTPLSPQKSGSQVPSFARETAASRTAREQRVGSRPLQAHHNHHTATEPTTPLAPMNMNWKARVDARQPNSPRHNSKRLLKAQQKPHLITPLGNGVNEPKTVNGMHYNPQLLRWEGNENAIAHFDVPLSSNAGSPKIKGLCIQTKPALIANVGSVKGVQVVGGMVFDPQRMCWLKIGPKVSNTSLSRSESGGMSPATEDDEEDVFAGLDDLDDGERKSAAVDGKGKKEGNLADEEWLVGEEFDVGPEFVRRQRAEEEKWRRKVEGWVGEGVGRDEGDEWKWAIRSLALSS
ncbi:hypothetical protein MMC19_001937 [Ptychographa xylographoides]|nr:hypothetical protein [Ptychographa xylographoides]